MNTKANEVLNSILFTSASEADKARLMMIANIGDCIAGLAKTGDLTPEIMKDHINLHLNELRSIESSEIKELISKATWAEAQAEAEKVSDVFGNEIFEMFMADLRSIGQF